MNEGRKSAAAQPDFRSDGSAELEARTALRLTVNDPAIRNYALAGFGSLAMIALLLLEQGSDIGAILIVLVGACGILLRFTPAPVLMLLLLTYFMWTPTGIPGNGYSYGLMIEVRRFHFLDVILVLSVLVCIASQYRMFGLIHQAIAFEGRVRWKDEPSTRRPSGLIRPSELSRLLGLSVLMVIVGQLIWLLATSVQVAPAEDFPLQSAESRSSLLKAQTQETRILGPRPYLDPRSIEEIRFQERGVLSRGVSRFFVLLGMLFFGTLLTTLVFRYWRLRAMGPAEGAMLLIDAGWEETHRERVRLEKWRVWGRKRMESAAERVKDTGRKP